MLTGARTEHLSIDCRRLRPYSARIRAKLVPSLVHMLPRLAGVWPAGDTCVIYTFRVLRCGPKGSVR